MSEQSEGESSIFRVKCKGRNRSLQEVLKEPVELIVIAGQFENDIYLQVGPCKYRKDEKSCVCVASGQEAYCVYHNFSLPYPF